MRDFQKSIFEGFSREEYGPSTKIAMELFAYAAEEIVSKTPVDTVTLENASFTPFMRMFPVTSPKTESLAAPSTSRVMSPPTDVSPFVLQHMIL
jgi:hypothetical protein